MKGQKLRRSVDYSIAGRELVHWNALESKAIADQTHVSSGCAPGAPVDQGIANQQRLVSRDRSVSGKTEQPRRIRLARERTIAAQHARGMEEP